MILSRTMREADYAEMVEEGKVIAEVNKAIDMWYPCQHHHRLWEYALAQKAFNTVFQGWWDLDKGTQIYKSLLVSDHGCGAGYLSPIMFWLGHHVWMYECWTFGNEEEYMLEQMRRVSLHRRKTENFAGSYEMRNRPLGSLVEADGKVDAAFCISTLEHIKDYRAAFRDLLNTVRVGGMAMITTDFAEDEEDHYVFSNLRAGKMFNKDTYEELLEIARGENFEVVGNQTDWVWDESCRLTNDYGFASMVLVRHGLGSG
jgi:2-polyprenyl-3-methyl-5-hydroxy-6-metoxy-1,4-benzoquinol methylase